MTSKTYTVTLQDSAIPVPFDPKDVFGKARAPVVVTLNGYTYRSTIAAMGGPCFIPLRRSHREAAGLDGTETLEIRLVLDTAERTVDAPPDLKKALKAAGASAVAGWDALSFTHQKEYVEAIVEAKKPETREKRLALAVTAATARAAKATAGTAAKTSKAGTSAKAVTKAPAKAAKPAAKRR